MMTLTSWTDTRHHSFVEMMCGSKKKVGNKDVTTFQVICCILSYRKMKKCQFLSGGLEYMGHLTYCPEEMAP